MRRRAFIAYRWFQPMVTVSNWLWGLLFVWLGLGTWWLVRHFFWRHLSRGFLGVSQSAASVAFKRLVAATAGFQPLCDVSHPGGFCRFFFWRNCDVRRFAVSRYSVERGKFFYPARLCRLSCSAVAVTSGGSWYRRCSVVRVTSPVTGSVHHGQLTARQCLFDSGCDQSIWLIAIFLSSTLQCHVATHICIPGEC